MMARQVPDAQSWSMRDARVPGDPRQSQAKAIGVIDVLSDPFGSVVGASVARGR